MDASVMAQVWWLWALLALVLGAVVGWLLASGRAAAHTRSLQRRAEQLSAEHADALQEAAAARSARDELQHRVDALESRSAQDLDVLRALAPLTDQLGSVGRHVQRLERERAEQFGAVAQALNAASSTDAALLEATSSLSSSLRSTTARGTWGEMQLRRVVEAAGMLRHVDFSEQDSRSTERGVQRPDLVISLPGNHCLVVDAKAPMSAYLDAQAVPGDGSAEHRAQREKLLAAHAKALKTHVDALAGKKYWAARDGSAELVLCFVPVESALAAALEADAGLLDHAARRNVALVSPVSLLASLKAVAFSWRQSVLTDDARELYRLSRELYDRMGSVGKHLADLGGSLRRSVEGYNKLVGSLESRVLPSARKIAALDPTDGATDALATTAVDTVPRTVTAPELLRDEDHVAHAGEQDTERTARNSA